MAMVFRLHLWVMIPVLCFTKVEEGFRHADSGGLTTYPVQCSSLHKNGYVLIKTRPCKIVKLSTYTSGKHGHAMVHMVGIDLFSGKTYEAICPSTEIMDVPYVQLKDYQFLEIVDGFVTLMAYDGDIRNDLKLPNSDVGKEMKSKFYNGETFMVTVLSALDEETIVSWKQK